MRYGKKDVIAFLQDVEGIDKTKAAHYLEDILVFIKETLLAGDELWLNDLGTFKVSWCAPRNGNVYDRKAGCCKVVRVPAHPKIKFNPSIGIKKELIESLPVPDKFKESGEDNE